MSGSAHIADNQVYLLAFLAGLTLAPFAVMLLTAYTKVIVVLSLLKNALGLQQVPPSSVLAGLAGVVALLVMAPTFERMRDVLEVERSRTSDGLLRQAARVGAPLAEFLRKHGSVTEREHLREAASKLRGSPVPSEDFTVLVAAFVITELKEAFVIGFFLFLPFLVVDIVTANILLALGTQSLSANQVSLPFKLLLFVAVDGWSLLIRGLLAGYG